jgi:hypothetical protein
LRSIQTCAHSQGVTNLADNRVNELHCDLRLVVRQRSKVRPAPLNRNLGVRF